MKTPSAKKNARRGIAAALCVALVVSAHAQIYNLTLTTTNPAGAPLSSFNLLLDTASASLQISNSATRIYLLSGTGQLSVNGTEYDFNGMRLRYGRFRNGFMFFVTNSVTSDWLNLGFFYPSNPFTTFSLPEAMGILQDSTFTPSTRQLILNGSSMEGISSFNFTEVPEPAVWLLTGAGSLVGLCLNRGARSQRQFPPIARYLIVASLHRGKKTLKVSPLTHSLLFIG